MYFFAFVQKEAELKHLKAQLQSLESQQKTQKQLHSSPFDPIPSLAGGYPFSSIPTMSQPLSSSIQTLGPFSSSKFSSPSYLPQPTFKLAKPKRKP